MDHLVLNWLVIPLLVIDIHVYIYIYIYIHIFIVYTFSRSIYIPYIL